MHPSCCRQYGGGGSGSPRVRKELRSLTPTEYTLLVSGLSTMLTVPTEAGQKMYGKQYKHYDYFIVKHAVAVNDPRGDQVTGEPEPDSHEQSHPSTFCTLSHNRSAATVEPTS